MENLKENFSKPTQIFNNGKSANTNLIYSGLRNYNNKISSKITSRNSSSEEKLLLINKLMLDGKFSKALNLAEDELKKDNKNSNLYNAIGALLYNKNEKDEAEKKFQKALILDNKNAHAFCNLGKIYKNKNDIISTLKCFKKAFSLNRESKVFFDNLNSILLEFTFSEFNTLWLEAYELILSDKLHFDELEMKVIHKNAVNFLILNPTFKEINLHINENRPLTNNFLETLLSFSKIKLTHLCLEGFIITNLKFERFIRKLREYLLINRKNIASKLEINKLIQSIALQNYIGEYIVYENENETLLIKNLEHEIEKEIAKNSISNFMSLLILGSYRDLKKYKFISKLNFPFEFLKIKETFVTLPAIENKIKKNIVDIGQIENHTSNQVKLQYEDNPYPKWKNLPLSPKKHTIKEYLNFKKINFKEYKTNKVHTLKVLVAGCGTGREPIMLTSAIKNLDVTAIDLSKSSLSYAIRKAKEHNLNNINFYQCDLLNIKELNTKFDIIICSGVLHHLDKPMEGWHQLNDALKDKGLMRISLYSKIARRELRLYQDKYANQDIRDYNKEIREFRNNMINHNKNFENIFSIFEDFFIMSELRDLIFHVKEHQFTLPEIKSCLKDLKLSFLGFDDKYITEKDNLNNKFNSFFNNKRNILDLDNWHELEKSNMDIFREMYQFWVQKT